MLHSMQPGMCNCQRCSSYELILCRRGTVVRETQNPIPQSEYHARLEGELEEGDLERTDPNIRYWSDYSRVFLDQKSIQAIPDALEGIEAGWNVGQDLFRRYNDVLASPPSFDIHNTSTGYGAHGRRVSSARRELQQFPGKPCFIPFPAIC